MSDTTETTRARRRLRMLGEVRALFAMVIGAAACLVVIGLIGLATGQGDLVPRFVGPILIIVGVVGDQLVRRRSAVASEELELAVRNGVRAEMRDSSTDAVADGVRAQA